MPKLKHLYIEQYPYIITTNTYNRHPIFNNEITCDILLETIRFCKSKDWYKLISFVIMIDHLHLIIVPEKKNISESMQSIKGYSSKKINETSGKNEKIWQDGFYDYIIDSEIKLLTKMKYIEENPVRKNLVSRPEDFKYSSANRREDTDYSMFF